MIKYNLLFIFRNFKRHKSSFFINLIGLTTGLTCVLLIYLWINDELSIDHFFDNDGRLFQVMQNTGGENGVETIEATPDLLAKALAEEMPEVAYSTAVIPPSFNISKGTISFENQHFELGGQYVTEDFFNVFSYQLIHGVKDQVLAEKEGVVISRELAEKLFASTEDAIGKTIEWNARDINGKYHVTGVYESPPLNATNQFDILLSFKLYEEINPFRGWGNSSARTYILLKENISPVYFNEKIREFLNSRDSNVNETLFAQQYSDRYLYGQYVNGEPAGGRIEYVKLFSIIAIFILIIACINFVNLSTAKASGRTKEVGIKKIAGVKRQHLIFHYMTESMILVLFSLLLAMLSAFYLLDPFNELTGKQITFDFDLKLIITILSVAVFTGILSGFYPAVYLSGFLPVNILKKQPSATFEGRWLRKGLVIFQFAISVLTIVAVWVTYQQMGFVQSKNLGFERDHLIYFNTRKMSQEFMSEIKNTPGVLNAGGGTVEAGKALGGTSGIQWEGKRPDDDTFFSNLWMTYNLIETLGMKMTDGQPFSEYFGSYDQIIFNETAIRKMGLKDPVGKVVTIEGQERQIVGVIKDFNFESLYEEVKPCALLLAPVEYAPRVTVKIQAGTEKSTINQLKELYQKYNPDQNFDVKFMDLEYQKLYKGELLVSSLTRWFAILAILISCLGLFGLASFTTERKTKEIGIRKVLGSTELGIVKLLSGDFTLQVVIGVVIALPVSYLITHRWLQTFTYHIKLEWWFFAGAGIITLLIAWLTVGLQTVKAAMVNPVECLKEE